MDILIACECSQVLCSRFYSAGHNVFSCDLQSSYGSLPSRHIRCDVTNLLNGKIRFQTEDMNYHYLYKSWDLIIAHPPCTYLSNVANRWYNVSRYGSSALQRAKLRESAAKFFMLFTATNAKYVCIENPRGYMSTYYRKPDQIIQPYYFGDPFQKLTCLWLFDLPKLVYTNVVVPEPRIVFSSGKSLPAWYSDAFHLSPDERANVRSKTFPGIADAIVAQWGCM